MAGVWGISPRRSVEAECARRGRDAVTAGCAALLAGGASGGGGAVAGGADVDEVLLRALAGPAAGQVLAGREGGLDGPWPRVWAARGLLHVWDPAAAGAVVRALGDESWRVREMAARVVTRHRVREALPAVALLRDDPVARVRAAATRAEAALTAGGAAPPTGRGGAPQLPAGPEAPVG